MKKMKICLIIMVLSLMALLPVVSSATNEQVMGITFTNADRELDVLRAIYDEIESVATSSVTNKSKGLQFEDTYAGTHIDGDCILTFTTDVNADYLDNARKNDKVKILEAIYSYNELQATMDRILVSTNKIESISTISLIIPKNKILIGY